MDFSCRESSLLSCAAAGFGQLYKIDCSPNEPLVRETPYKHEVYFSYYQNKTDLKDLERQKYEGKGKYC